MTTDTTNWLRHRAIGKRQKVIKASLDSMNRLQLEATLKGHQGCVNCLEWNRPGNLLASASDDRDVIIWDPFSRTHKKIVRTGHESNIFSVKFMPGPSEYALVATSGGDGSVKLFNLYANELIMDCKRCHSDRVKRLAVHPNEPHLLWSAGEDGNIMQYDIREEHCCKSKSKNLLIDLKSTGLPLSAKCLAVNPIKDEMLAIGANDNYVRLFDRRYITADLWNSCTTYLTPGHLLCPNNSKATNHPQSHGTTYVSFSPDGSELLANLHAEQVYLFNTYKPWERYKSFEATLKPLIHDCPPSHDETNKTYSLFRDLKKNQQPIELPDRYSSFYQEVSKKFRNKPPDGSKVTKDEIDQMNIILSEIKNCAKLYHLRAGALIQRGWRGDNYQAIRDCCSAFALEPTNQMSLENLAFASYYIGDRETSMKLLESLNNSEISNALTSLVEREDRQPSPPTVEWFEWGEVGETYYGDMMGSQDTTGESQRGNEVTDNNENTAGPRDLFISISNDVLTRQYINQMMSNHPDSTGLHRMFVRDANNRPDIDQINHERQRSQNAFDYSKRFCGHCNLNTDIKEANFFGQDGEFIVAGSDDGAFYIWDKHTTNIVKAVHGDHQVLNCVQPHPSICMLATSGIDTSVKLWSPGGGTCHDVNSLEVRCAQNQEFILSDPLEAMVMMLYANRDI